MIKRVLWLAFAAAVIAVGARYALPLAGNGERGDGVGTTASERGVGDKRSGLEGQPAATREERQDDAMRQQLYAAIAMASAERQKAFYSERRSHLQREIQALETALQGMQQAGQNRLETPKERIDEGVEKMRAMIADRAKELDEVVANLDRLQAEF